MKKLITGVAIAAALALPAIANEKPFGGQRSKPIETSAERVAAKMKELRTAAKVKLPVLDEAKTGSVASEKTGTTVPSQRYNRSF